METSHASHFLDTKRTRSAIDAGEDVYIKEPKLRYHVLEKDLVRW